MGKMQIITKLRASFWCFLPVLENDPCGFLVTFIILARVSKFINNDGKVMR